MEMARMNRNVSRWVVFMISLGCSLAFSAPVEGQNVGDPAKAQMQEMDRRELQLNSLGEANSRPNDAKRAQALMDQVGEDFQRILTLHNEMVRSISANRSLSYKFISDATGEIKKRAAHLQSSLRLQKSEPTTDDQAMAKLKLMAMNDQLIVLCKRIESFVKNPMIDKPGTVDPQQLEDARKDLQSILEISATIKKQVDKENP